MRSACSVLILLLAASAVAKAQALPTASRQPIEAGVAFSFGSPAFQDTPTYVEGFTVFGNLGLTGRLGAQVDLHLDSYLTPIDIGENTFLIGPRFSVLREDRANVYVKGMGGLGRFAYQANTYLNPHSDTYGVFAFGGGVEYRLSRSIDLRAIDLEFQTWPGFPSGSIHPVVASIGFAWRL